MRLDLSVGVAVFNSDRFISQQIANICDRSNDHSRQDMATSPPMSTESASHPFRMI
jgi:hypothetical protein